MQCTPISAEELRSIGNATKESLLSKCLFFPKDSHHYCRNKGSHPLFDTEEESRNCDKYCLTHLKVLQRTQKKTLEERMTFVEEYYERVKHIIQRWHATYEKVLVPYGCLSPEQNLSRPPSPQKTCLAAIYVFRQLLELESHATDILRFVLPVFPKEMMERLQFCLRSMKDCIREKRKTYETYINYLVTTYELTENDQRIVPLIDLLDRDFLLERKPSSCMRKRKREDDQFTTSWTLLCMMSECSRPPSEKTDCAVCLCGMTKDAMKLSCGHLFHEKCIRSWVRSKKSPADITCPCCREKLLEGFY